MQSYFEQKKNVMVFCFRKMIDKNKNYCFYIVMTLWLNPKATILCQKSNIILKEEP